MAADNASEGKMVSYGIHSLVTAFFDVEATNLEYIEDAVSSTSLFQNKAKVVYDN